MRCETVKRYFCDFCKKSGGSASSMSVHEKYCTGNQNRICRMCETAGREQPPIEALIAAALADVEPIKAERAALPEGVWNDAICEALSREAAPVHLHEVAGGCPACMLTGMRAIRDQAEDIRFDFSWELANKTFWSEFPPRE